MCFLQRQSNWCFVNMRITNRNFHLGLLQLIRFESLWWLMLSFYQLNHFQISNVNLTKLCLATPWTKTNEWINYVSWYEEKVSDELGYSKIPTKDRWILRLNMITPIVLTWRAVQYVYPAHCIDVSGEFIQVQALYS